MVIMGKFVLDIIKQELAILNENGGRFGCKEMTDHSRFFKPKSDKEAAEFVDKHAGKIKPLSLFKRLKEWWYNLIRLN